MRRAKAGTPRARKTAAAGGRGRPARARTPQIATRLVDAIEEAIGAEHQNDPFRRDPQAVEQAVKLADLLNAYFGGELLGWKNVPKKGPMLIVGNHSGGMASVDPVPFLIHWVRERGAEAPLYFLAYDLLFAVPRVGPWLRRIGLLPASHANAEKALARGGSVIVFPGGDHEVFRPWTERNRITFGGRTGFIRLALSAGVPVVPMTIHGAHESTIVLTRGREIARWIGSDRIKVNVFPIIFGLPFGVTPAFVPSLPLPAKMTVEIGKPLNWSRYGPEGADDPRVLRRCYREITDVMQTTLDRLAARHPYPILSRIREVPSRRLLRAIARVVG